MSAEDASDASHAAALAVHLNAEPTARCPQFRSYDLERVYPVRGYCVLTQSPGWFMIPSIEEYRNYCTSWGFHRCPWCRQNGAAAAPLMVQAPQQEIQTEIWRPPETGGPGCADQD